MLIINPIFIETFGGLLLSNKNLDLAQESKSLFFLSTLVGQTVFSCFSSINRGIMVFPMFEMSKHSNSILEECSSSKNPLNSTLLCLFSASILSFLIALLLSVTKKGQVLSKIPISIVDSMMIVTAFSNIYVGFHQFKIPERLWLSVSLFTASFFITVCAILILKKTERPNLVILFLIFIILVMNSLKFAFSLDKLVALRLFVTSNPLPLNLKPLRNFFLDIDFDYGLIRKNISRIIILSISPLLSISTSLLFYSKYMKIDIDYNKELLTIGITNLFTGFPASFNCFGSILFQMCGANTKEHSIFGGLALSILLFTQHYISLIIPTFALSLLSLFIGFMILSGYIKSFASLTPIDKILLTAMTILSLYTGMNIIIVLIGGLLLTIGLSFFFLKGISSENPSFTVEKSDQELVIRVKKSVDYRNIQEIVNIIRKEKSNIIIDLLNTKYVDYTANKEFEEIIDESIKVKKIIKILGNPYNFNKNILSHLKNRSQ